MIKMTEMTKIIENDKKLFDPISVIYSIRQEKLNIGDKYSFSVLVVFFCLNQL